MEMYDMYDDVQAYWTMRESLALEDMTSPVRCAFCQGVYDMGTVVITHRYSDCTIWRTPCCNNVADDRGETGWKSRQDYHRIPKDGEQW